MDDLNATIGAILGDPQKMEQLRAVAQSLGLNPPDSAGSPQGGSPPGQAGGGFDPSMIASMLQGFQGMGGGGNANAGGGGGGGGGATPEAPGQAAAASPLGGLNLGAISKISEIYSTYTKSDKNTDLLRSLKPHFSSARAGKIDDAIRIMQMLRAWPALRDSGLLNGLGNLFGGGGAK